jgi:hypothetical protein
VRTVRLFTTLVVFGLFSLTASAQQDQTQSPTGDPVADAARKAREQKKLAPKPKKIFTDEDVAKLPSMAPPAPAASTEPSTAATPAPSSEPRPQSDASSNDASSKKEDPNSEAAWRKRFAAQRKKIEIAEQELNVLQREAEKADLQYYSDPQKAMNEQLTRSEINEKNDKIAAKKKEIADLKQQFSDMEDEVRRTGGDPGWAR